MGRAKLFRRYGIAGPGTLLAGVGAAYVGFVDPHQAGAAFPLCPFRLVTGWNCPACGGLRMVHDLLHGDLAAAVLDNAFLLGATPLLTIWILLMRRRRDVVSPVPVLVVAVVAATAWAVVRNLPGFPLTPTTLSG